MKVKSVNHLMRLALRRKSVRVPWIGLSKRWHLPAAFLIGMPARMVQGYINSGLEVYEP